MRRLVAVLSIVALCTAACTNDKKDAEITPQPTDDTRVEQIAEFQLVGTIEKAFASIETPVALPADDAAVSGPTTEPAATPVGEEPSVPGVLRVNVEDANEELNDACGVAVDQDVRVYWTTDTSFDPSDVLDDTEADLEEGIEDRVAGISGRVFRAGRRDLDTPEPDETDETTEDPDLTDASPFAIGPPDAGEDADLAGCVLVADQIGFRAGGRHADRRPGPQTDVHPDGRAQGDRRTDGRAERVGDAGGDPSRLGDADGRAAAVVRRKPPAGLRPAFTPLAPHRQLQ
jgi:hypothetical protein